MANIFDLLETKNVSFQKGESLCLTTDYINVLLDYNLIIDATWGGLLLGNSHDDGGVVILSPDKDGDVCILGEMEGFEYIMNYSATINNKAAIDAIDDSFPDKMMPFTPYEIPTGTAMIDARDKNIGGAMVTPYIYFRIFPMRVINRNVTGNNLALFDKFNRDEWSLSDTLYAH